MQPKTNVSRLLQPHLLLSFCCILVAMLAFVWHKMPNQLLPTFDSNKLYIDTYWQGAAASDIEKYIGIEVESAIGAVAGVKNIINRSSFGHNRITLEFESVEAMRQSYADVLSNVQQANQLPRNIAGPSLSFDRSSEELTRYFLEVSTPDKDPRVYGELVEKLILPRLRAVPGVGLVEVANPAQRYVKIELNAAKLSQYGLSFDDVKAVLDDQQVQVSGFSTLNHQTVQLLSAPTQLQQLDNIVLNQAQVRLFDVAQVSIDYFPRQDLVLSNGAVAFSIGITKARNIDSLTTLRQLNQQVDYLNQHYLKAKGLKLVQSFDSGGFITEALGSVAVAFVAAMALAGFFLWHRLGNGKMALVVFICTPIAVLSALVLSYFWQSSINVISMAGLSLSVGFIIDYFVIILIEIANLSRGRMDSDKVIVTALHKVARPLLASTLTTIAILLPTAYGSGIDSALLYDLSMVVFSSLLGAVFCAFVVMPPMVRLLCRNGMLVVKQARSPALLIRLSQGLVNANWPLPLFLTLIVVMPLVLTVMVRPGFSILPDIKRQAVDIWIDTNGKDDIDFIGQTLLQPLSQKLLSHQHGEAQPVTRNFYGFTYPGGTGVGVRPQDPEQLAELQQQVEDYLSEWPQYEYQIGQDSLFGTLREPNLLRVVLAGGSVADSSAAADDLSEALKPFNVRIQNPLQSIGSQKAYEVEFDNTRLAMYRLSVEQAREQLKSVVSGYYSGEFYATEGSIPMLLSQQDKRSGDLNGFSLLTDSGALVPLSDVARVKLHSAAKTLTRINQNRAYQITLFPSDNLSLERIENALESQILPQLLSRYPGLTQAYVRKQADNLQASLHKMAAVFAIGSMALFLILMNIYRSSKLALLIISAIPLAFLGGVLGLVVVNPFFQQAMDMVSFLGLAILMGVIVNNGVLIVDYCLEYGETTPLNELVKGVFAQRYNAIFITTMSTVIGMIPLIVNTNQSADLYRGLASVVCFGLLLGLPGSVFITLKGYSYFHRKGNRNAV